MDIADIIEIRRPRIRFRDIAPTIIILCGVIILTFVLSVMIITKNPKIIDENYKGKYVQVMTYSTFNSDSTIRLYNKPREAVAIVINVHKHHLHVNLNGEDFSIGIRRSDREKYHEGQKVKVMEYFYPYRELFVK